MTKAVEDFWFWHFSDMALVLGDVRSSGQSGKHLLALSFSGFDPFRKSGCQTPRKRCPPKTAKPQLWLSEKSAKPMKNQF
ncbi:MAG TPA: hypothetical protein VN956_25765 [Pyrinomonadaceae bacterium]|nr:hypothetical protein [Pyrinomonadaceae bacterium]